MPSAAFSFFGPWVPSLLVILVAALVGWEGTICIYMATPVLLLLSSFGGVIGAQVGARRGSATTMLVMLPYLLAPVERGYSPEPRVTETVSAIDIAAPPDRVWPLIASVDSIRPEEVQPALYIRMGFPRPISATLLHPGVGGVRTARFERGLVFTETVTAWEPGARLSFTIRPITGEIPPTTLDPHVTIGGPYFDVLTVTYELRPTGTGTRLVLRSRQRVSTRFNLYAGWWADRLMESFQRSILAAHKMRAERDSRAYGAPHERISSPPLGPGRASRRRPVPRRRPPLRDTRRIGCIQSGASCVAASGLGDQRRRVRRAHRVRTCSAAYFACHNSITRIVGRWPGGLRTCDRSKYSCADRVNAPTFPSPRPRDMASCYGAAGVCCRASFGCRARPSAAQTMSVNEDDARSPGRY
jgi:hypothetical protein